MALKTTYAQPVLSKQVTGSYRISKTTGVLAAALAAGAQIFQFKFTAGAQATPQVLATHAVITRLRARILPCTPFTAATLDDHTSLDAFVARSYAGGGSGSALTLTGNNAKAQTNMATSLAAINIATTAALTAATTLDANPFAQSLRRGNRVNPAAATEEIIPPTNHDLEYWPQLDGGEVPLVLGNLEGIVIANRTVWPAAGTAIVSVEIAWTECIGFGK